MDFSKRTIDEIQTAYDRAVAANDFAVAMMLQKEIDDRISSSEKTSDAGSNVFEQGVSGIYEGLASGLGAPVDIVTSGLNAIGAGIERPIGGRESIEGLFQLMSGDNAISQTEPQTAGQRIARGTGRIVGETAPATVGMLAAAPKAVVSGADDLVGSVKNALAGMKSEAKAAPVSFAGTEAAAAVGGGLAASSVAEVLPDNPTAQVIANILGAVAGGKAATIPDRLLQPKTTGPMSADDLKSAAGELYDKQRDFGLSAQPDVTENIYSEVFSNLDNGGYLTPIGKGENVTVASDYPKLRQVVKTLEKYADKGMTAARIQTMRRSISGRMNDAVGEERNALRNVLRVFDENTASLAPEIKVANAMYSRAMKADQVEEMLELAKTRATANNLDLENSMRIEFRSLLRKIIKGQERGWSQDEINQIKQIVEGGDVENIARFLGKFAPTGPVSLMSGGVLPLIASNITRDPLVLGGIAGTQFGLGVAGKMAGSRIQQQNIDRLYQSIVQGRNLTPQASARLRQALGAYFAGQAASAATGQ
jgi:hypothetical protein